MTTPSGVPQLHAVPKPSGPKPVVSFTVNSNSFHRTTPYEVAVLIRAATTEDAIEALDRTFAALDAQLVALGKEAYVPRG